MTFHTVPPLNSVGDCESSRHISFSLSFQVSRAFWMFSTTQLLLIDNHSFPNSSEGCVGSGSVGMAVVQTAKAQPSCLKKPVAFSNVLPLLFIFLRKRQVFCRQSLCRFCLRCPCFFFATDHIGNINPSVRCFVAVRSGFFRFRL